VDLQLCISIFSGWASTPPPSPPPAPLTCKNRKIVGLFVCYAPHTPQSPAKQKRCASLDDSYRVCSLVLVKENKAHIRRR